MIIFPMAAPQPHESGLIWYVCPLDCGWSFSLPTPPFEGLDEHQRLSREMLSGHYQVSHGVIVDE